MGSFCEKGPNACFIKISIFLLFDNSEMSLHIALRIGVVLRLSWKCKAVMEL